MGFAKNPTKLFQIVCWKISFFLLKQFCLKEVGNFEKFTSNGQIMEKPSAGVKSTYTAQLWVKDYRLSKLEQKS